MKKTTLFLASLLLVLSCNLSTLAQTSPATATQGQAELSIIIGDNKLKFTPLRNYQELRLEVFNSAGELIYTSGAVTEAELNWNLRDSNGAALAPGLYAYTLFLKVPDAEAPRQHHGHFILEKGSDQIWLTTKGDGSIGAEVTGGAVTVARNPERTTAGTGYLASGRTLSERAGLQRDAQNRTVAGQGQLTPETGPALNQTGSGTANRITKWLTANMITDSVLYETAGGDLGIGTITPGGVLDVQRNSPNPLIGRFWNTGTGPAQLRFVGGTGSTSQFLITDSAEWLTSIAVNNSMGMQLRVRGVGTPNNEAELSNSARLAILRNGNVGIGTTLPLGKLQVATTADTNPSFVTAWDSRHFVVGADASVGGVAISYDQLENTGHIKALSPNVAFRNLGLQVGGGNVGIGTSAPTERLHVNGNIRVADDSSIFGLDYLVGFNDLRLAGDPVGDADVLISAAGNMGVGTMGPGHKLHIVSAGSNAAKVESSASFGTWQELANTSGGGKNWQFISTGPANGEGAGDLLFRDGTVGSVPMMIDRDGNVGIGTVFPATKLHVFSLSGTSVHGSNNTGNGVYGRSTTGTGVYGSSNAGTGVYGSGDSFGVYGDTDNSSGYAGYFRGKVRVTGVIEKPGGGFKIDHPLEPENKYLIHSFVESPDMKNLYDGVVTTDVNGDAEVTLPDWFAALNRDFRYQLTCIGVFAQAIIAGKIRDNRFKVKTSIPNVEVSWLVTGIRKDAWANQNRLPVEELKPEVERGLYQNPTAFGQPEEKSIEWARRPEMMKQMKENREKARRAQETGAAEPPPTKQHQP